MVETAATGRGAACWLPCGLGIDRVDHPIYQVGAMNTWSPARPSTMLFEGPDGPFPKVIGWVLGGTFAVACALGALFSFPYAFLGYLIGQLAIVLMVSDYLVGRVIGTGHVMLLVAVLSLDERRLFQGYRPFLLFPIAASDPHSLPEIHPSLWRRVARGCLVVRLLRLVRLLLPRGIDPALLHCGSNGDRTLVTTRPLRSRGQEGRQEGGK